VLIKREWATPLVIGAFTLSGLTGLSLLFHFNTQLGTVIHEWFGLIFVVGGLSHVTVNFPAFKRHLKQPLARTIIIAYVALTVAAFVPIGSPRGGDGMMLFMDAALNAPLNDLARVLKKDPQVLLSQLQSEGFKMNSIDQSIASVTGQEPEQRFRALQVLVK
jgi:hypothetical protein